MNFMVSGGWRGVAGGGSDRGDGKMEWSYVKI